MTRAHEDFRESIAGVTTVPDRVGIIVIGRNEGERLVRCLASIDAGTAPCVYVDSDSSDDSPTRARDAGFDVVVLGRDRPLNAARARNAGLARLREIAPGIEFVQFIDGDTALDPGWLGSAASDLGRDDGLTALCGVLAERNAEISLARRLCQVEWTRPPGPTDACGGIMMVRVRPLLAVGGFCEDMAAGEEAELCGRLAAEGGAIVRAPRAMGVHDSGIDGIWQWLLRAGRAGQAYAHAVALHPKDNGKRRKLRSALGLGVVVPILMLTCVVAAVFVAAPWGIGALALGALYAVVASRAARDARQRAVTARDARLYGIFCAIAKPFEGWRALRHLLGYKRAGA